MTTGPPLSHVNGATRGSSSAHHRVASRRNVGSAVDHSVMAVPVPSVICAEDVQQQSAERIWQAASQAARELGSEEQHIVKLFLSILSDKERTPLGWPATKAGRRSPTRRRCRAPGAAAP